MAIAFGAVGTRFAGGTTAATPIAIAYPTGITAGQMLLLFVTVKVSTITVTTPSGWNLIGSFTGGTGTTAIDAGTTRTAVYWREATGSESGTVSVAFSAAPTGHTGFIVRYTKSASSTWVTPTAVNGADTTHGTAWSTTGSANLSVTTGDLVVLGNGNDTDLATAYTTPTLTATGATISTPTVRLAQGGSASSDDCGCNLYDAPVTAGTSSAAPVHTLAAGPSACGETAFIRLRENFDATKSGSDTASTVESASVTGAGIPDPPTFPDRVNLAIGTGTRTLPTVTTQAGDWLVCEIIFETSMAQDPTLSPLTWTEQNDADAASHTEVWHYTTQDATGGTRAIQIAGIGQNYTANLTVVRGSDGPGTGKATSTTGQTVSVTRQGRNSAMFIAIGDWFANPVGTPVWTPGGATTYSELLNGVMTVVFGRLDNAGMPATEAHGISSPTYGTPSIAVLEMLGHVTAGGPTAIDGSDTAAGTDAGTLATDLTPAADARTAVDAGTLGATLTPATDLRTMVDAGTLLASFSGTEAGASADAPSGPLSATLAGADTGTRVEAYQLTVVLQSADTGAGADAGSVGIGATDKSGAETATAVDAATLATSQTRADTAGAADVATMVVTITGSDLRSVVDTVLALAATHQGADTGTQVEGYSLMAGGNQSSGESSSTVEVGTLAIQLAGSDTSSATENQTVLPTIPQSGSETSSTAENRTLAVQLTASEIVTAIEGFSLSAGGNPAGTDTSTHTETLLLTVAVTGTDGATTVDQGALNITLLKSGADTATFVDSAALLAQLTVAQIVAAAEVLAVLTGPQTWEFISADLRVFSSHEGTSSASSAISGNTAISINVSW